MSDAVGLAADDAPEATPDPQSGPRARSSFGIVLVALCVAIAGGIGATVLYDRMVTVPAPRADADAPPVPAAPVLAPPLDQDEYVAEIDPFAQAILSVRPELGDDALVKVQARAEGDVVFLTGEADSRRTLARVTEAISQLPGIRALDTRAVAIVNRTHVVEPGDNLSRLARRYYGATGEWPRLVEANPELENGGVLRIGQALTIPPPDR